MNHLARCLCPHNAHNEDPSVKTQVNLAARGSAGGHSFPLYKAVSAVVDWVVCRWTTSTITEISYGIARSYPPS